MMWRRVSQFGFIFAVVIIRHETDRARSIASGQSAPTAEDIVTLSGLVDRIGRSLSRLDTAADSAASDGSHTALAALSAQLHRGIEVVAKIRGLGSVVDPERTPFSITFNLTTAQRTPTTAPLSEPRIVDAGATLVVPFNRGQSAD